MQMKNRSINTLIFTKKKEEEIQSVQGEIKQLQSQLIKERQNQKNKQDYDALISVINEHPTRDQTQREISVLKSDLEVLAKETETTATKFDLRTKQFQLLLYSIHQLQQTLEEETIQQQQQQQQSSDPIDNKEVPLEKMKDDEKIDINDTEMNEVEID